MHAAQLRDHLDQIRSRGADLVAIGTGDSRYAQAFVDEERIPFLVLLDDNAAAAAAASLVSSAARAMSVRSVVGGIRAALGGQRQRRTGRRPFQMGGTFVVGPGSVVRYEHVDRDPADHAPMDDVLAALDSPAN